MTKTEIARRLDDLAIEMRNLSLDMEYYCGFSPWAKHAQQMHGAAIIAEQWATEIRKEAGNANIIPIDPGHVRHRPPGNSAQKLKNRNRKTQKRQSKAEGVND